MHPSSSPASDRRDLLAYLARYAREPRLQIRRAERWRRRGWRLGRIEREAGRVAAALAARGIGPGDRVALHLNDGPLWHAAFFGVLRLGAVAVPLDPSIEPESVRPLVEDLELSAWCTEREVAELGLDLPQVELDWRAGTGSAGSPPPWPADDPARVAQIVLTSGTSGAPKAVPVTHANLRAVLDALDEGVARYRRWIDRAPRIRIAVALPLSHLYGQVMGVFVPAILPAHAVFLPAMPGAEMARALRAEKAWVIATVPRTLELLADHLRAVGDELWGADGFARRLRAAESQPWWRRRLAFRRLHSVLGQRLVAVVSGGAALDPRVESLWRALGYGVVQGYGLTETAPLVTLNHPFDEAPGALGRPLPGVEVRLAPDGEILVRGPNVAVARLGGRAVDEEGWLHTGDLGRWDDGRLVYLGRKGERIVTSAGVNVDPEPIIAALKARREVVDALVLERPWGRPGVVCAVILARPGADPAEAVARVNESLPDAARIREWRLWPETDFPRTRTGKPRHPEIQAWLEAQAPGAGRAEAERGAETRSGADAVAAVRALAASIADLPLESVSPDDPIGEILTSLDRVELATRLETSYGATLDFDAFAGEKTLREIAEDALGGSPEAAGRGLGTETAEAAMAPPVAVAARVPYRPVPEARWRHTPAVRAARYAVRDVLVQGFWRPMVDTRFRGLDRLGDLEPPFLIAPNHLSILDPLALLFALPFRLRRRVATSAMWEHFVVGGRRWQYPLAVLGLNLYPLVQIGDWRPTLRIAGGLADRGWCPVLFPEGARSDDGRLLPFRQGIAIMARELHLPVVPCALMGTGAIMPRGAKWFHHCWLGRAPVAVRFGEPLAAPRPGEDPRRFIDELARRMELLRLEALADAGRP